MFKINTKAFLWVSSFSSYWPHLNPQTLPEVIAIFPPEFLNHHVGFKRIQKLLNRYSIWLITVVWQTAAILQIRATIKVCAPRVCPGIWKKFFAMYYQYRGRELEKETRTMETTKTNLRPILLHVSAVEQVTSEENGPYPFWKHRLLGYCTALSRGCPKARAWRLKLSTANSFLQVKHVVLSILMCVYWIEQVNH